MADTKDVTLDALPADAQPEVQTGDRVDLGTFVLNLAYMVAEVVKDGGTAYQLADMSKGTDERRVLVIVTSGEAADVMYGELVKKQMEQELVKAPTPGGVQ